MIGLLARGGAFLIGRAGTAWRHLLAALGFGAAFSLADLLGELIAALRASSPFLAIAAVAWAANTYWSRS